jgi:hypothetical protein
MPPAKSTRQVPDLGDDLEPDAEPRITIRYGSDHLAHVVSV